MPHDRHTLVGLIMYLKVTVRTSFRKLLRRNLEFQLPSFIASKDKIVQRPKACVTPYSKPLMPKPTRNIVSAHEN